MNKLAVALRATPDVYPHTYDTLADAVMMIPFSSEGYAAASFLDQRALKPDTQRAWMRWPEVAAAIEGLTPPREAGWIFHIGHVGSTLLSRLLGANPGILSLREPAPLRALSQLAADADSPESLLSPDGFAERLAGFVNLWSRTYAAAQLPIVKATSFTSALGPRLMARPAQPRALLMYAKPQSYLAGIMGGEASRQENQAMAQARLRRLHARLEESPWRLHALSEGERAAVAWACEMTSLGAVAEAGGDRALWFDFDAFLAEPADGLSNAFAHFGVAPAAGEIEAALAGPLMLQYSKGPEHAYSPQLRRDVHAGAQVEHGAEIAKGLAWLEAAGKAHPVIAAALER